MKKIKFNLLFSLFFCILAVGCSDKDEIPVDADDNFITSVVLSVNDNTYEAVIENNTITVTVPYTVSLDGAKASFVYTPSAKIIPDPATITDWNVERTFRVTSFNGATNDYTYVVIKDEIRHEGDVELKTPSDVASFVASGATIIKGNLIIGSDADNAEEIKDISALEILKEVEGDIIIRQSYTGGTLTGLDNITSIGGLLIGSEDDPLPNTTLEMISMSKIKNVTGDIQIFGSGASIIEFKELEKVDGNIIFNENTKLTQISLPVLKETKSLEFKVLPREFSSLSVPDIAIINGNLSIESIWGEVESAGMRFFMGNTELKSIEGFDKLTSVMGVLSIQNFDVLEKLPQLQELNQLGGLVLRQLALIESVDISNVSFISSSLSDPCVTIEYCKKLGNLTTKEDLIDVDVKILSINTSVKTNFTKINNFHYQGNIDNFKASIQRITGNLSIIQTSGQSSTNTIDLSGINSIPGYLLITGFSITSVKASDLKSIGGQSILQVGTDALLDFSNLTTVCCGSSPVYIEENLLSVLPLKNMEWGAFSIFMDGTITDSYFPVLNHIGGTGLTLFKIYESASFPNLEVIDGSLNFGFTTDFISSNHLKLPKLLKLSGVHFDTVRQFSDFTFFKKFIDDGQITESNWKVENCTYNPTYQDMKEGRCKPAE